MSGRLNLATSQFIWTAWPLELIHLDDSTWLLERYIWMARLGRRSRYSGRLDMATRTDTFGWFDLATRAAAAICLDGLAT